MTRTRLSIALLVLFAPVVALAHGGGNGNGGVGGGMGNGNGGIGGGMGNGNGGIGGGMGNGNGGIGNSSNGVSGSSSSDRAVEASLDSDSAIGRLAQSKQDAKDRAAARLAASNKSKGVSSNAHGKAVSAEAKLAKSENDGDTVGEDVRVVAQDKSTLNTHASSHTKLASSKTHPVNHGADVSAEAKLAKSENDGDTVGADVSAVAKSNSHGHGKATAKGHTRTRK